MAAEVIKEFLIGIGIDVDKGALGKFEGNMKSIATAALGVAAAIQLAAAGIYLFTQGVAKELDDLGELATRINSTAGAIKEFGYVAQLSDSSTEAATASLEGLNKAAGQASLGLGRGRKIFEKLGISVFDANNEVKKSSDLMWEVGDAVKGLGKGAQVAALEGLGIDKTLVNTLTSDVAGLRDEFNSLYSQNDINAATADASLFMDAYDRLTMYFKGLSIKLAAFFFKPFTANMQKLLKFMSSTLPKVIEFFAPLLNVIIRVASFMVGTLAQAFSIVWGAISIVVGWLKTIDDAFGGVLGKIALLVIGIKLLSMTMLATPIGALLALSVAILALIDDYQVWKRGGDSLFDWSSYKPFFDGIGKAVDNLSASLRLLFSLAFETFGMIYDLLHLDFSGAASKISMMGGSVDQFEKETGGNTRAGYNQFGWNNNKPAAPTALQNEYAPARLTPAQPLGLTPSPADKANLINNNAVITQKTDIHVNGAGNAKDVANNVMNNQNRVNGDMVRNMKGSTR